MLGSTNGAGPLWSPLLSIAPSTFTLMVPRGRTMLSGAPNGKVWPVLVSNWPGLLIPDGIRVDRDRDDRVGHVAGDPAVNGPAAVCQGAGRGLVQERVGDPVRDRRRRLPVEDATGGDGRGPGATWPASSPRRRAPGRSPTGSAS